MHKRYFKPAIKVTAIINAVGTLNKVIKNIAFISNTSLENCKVILSLYDIFWENTRLLVIIINTRVEHKPAT